MTILLLILFVLLCVTAMVYLAVGFFYMLFNEGIDTICDALVRVPWKFFRRLSVRKYLNRQKDTKIVSVLTDAYRWLLWPLDIYLISHN